MKSISQVIANPSSILYRLLQHSQTLKQLNQVFQATLPLPLKQHCSIANLRNRILVIHTDSALWATRLRYLSPELLYHWQQDGTMPAIDKIEVRIRPLPRSTK